MEILYLQYDFELCIIMNYSLMYSYINLSKLRLNASKYPCIMCTRAASVRISNNIKVWDDVQYVRMMRSDYRKYAS